MKYIYYTKNRGYHVMRKLNGKMVSFGYYPTIASAQYVRDEMEKFNWNKDYLKGVKRRMIQNGIGII